MLWLFFKLQPRLREALGREPARIFYVRYGRTLSVRLNPGFRDIPDRVLPTVSKSAHLNPNEAIPSLGLVNPSE